MTETLILQETTISVDDWVWNSQFGAYTATIAKTFSLTAGETYRIVCNGASNEASLAHDISGLVGMGMVAVGDLRSLGLPANTGRYILGDGGTINMFLMTSLPQSNPPGSYTFSVYHAVEEEEPEEPDVPEEPEEPETPPDDEEQTGSTIALKDRQGKDLTFKNVKAMNVLLADGTEQMMLPGEAEEKTVDLDFSAGDMVVEPGKGKLITKVSIPQPRNLIPEAIVKDVEIAGVVGTYDPISGGLGEKYLNFYDCHGNLLHAYTKGEALALTELPEVPDHPDYGSGQWNWTLEKIMDALDYSEIDVAATYYFQRNVLGVHLVSTKTFSFTVYGTLSNPLLNIDIDWGDGVIQTNQTLSAGGSKAFSHTYSDYGEYDIIITPRTGSAYADKNLYLYTASPMQAIKKVHIGCRTQWVKSIGAFSKELLFSYDNKSTTTIQLPQAKTASFIAIPRGYTECSAMEYLYSVAIVSFPSTLTKCTSFSFYNSVCLQRVPNMKFVTSGSQGSYPFQYAYALQKAVFPKIGSIGVTSNVFAYCYKLRKITLSEGVTSIGSYFARNCDSLETLILPSTITSVGSSFLLNSASATQTQVKIYAPDDVVATYKTLANLKNFASRIYPLSELPADA